MDDIHYKVVLIGGENVGKIDIIRRFIKGQQYSDNSVLATTGASHETKTFDLPSGKSITLDIWDTPGQTRYISLVKIILKKADAVILVYDITNEKSFTELKEYWYEQIKQNLDKQVIFVVAGNKSELYDKEKVSKSKGIGFAKSIGTEFFSTSAINNSGIQEMFEFIGQKLLDNKVELIKENNKDEFINENNKDELIKEKDKENKKNCLIY